MKRILKTSIYTILSCIIFFSGLVVYSAFNNIEIRYGEIVEKYNPVVRADAKYEAVIRLLNGNTLCSGVVISDTYALTAAHCVSGFFGGMDIEDIIVSGVNNEFTNTKAVAVAVDKYRDVALLKGNFTEFNTIIADFTGTSVKNLTDVLAISCGFPGNGELFCSKLQLISNESFMWVGDKGSLYKGMSGGPLFGIDKYNMTIKVIGINSAVRSSRGLLFGGIVGLDEEFGIR